MKVKFNRAKLVAALKSAKDQALVQYRKDVKAHHETLEKSHAKLIGNVEKFLAELKRTKTTEVDDYNLGRRLTKDVSFPTKPREPRLAQVDNLIQQLELAVGDVIVCDTKDEYAQLTRVCAILGTCKA